MLKPTPGIKMLDVGSGPANILAYLPSLHYTGVDLNEKHIAFARELCGNRGRISSTTPQTICGRTREASI